MPLSDQYDISDGPRYCEGAVGCGRNGMIERRRNARIPLHCVLRLSREGEPGSLITKTENISSTGFYCIVPHQFSVGDRLECDIQIPVHRFALSGSELHLTCKAMVTRVQAVGAEFGIGCEFREFGVRLQ